jgi:bifunctional UDP-N-acetylglucosamine 2-epimerase / N-acetylmannosamine kinase
MYYCLMKQLLTVLSARASYSRVRSVLLSLKDRSDISLHVILIASAASAKYGKLENFLLADGIKVNWKVESQSDAALESSMVRTTSYSMIGISDYILNNGIDGVLVIADRHETIAGSIAGSYLNRITFHLLGGEISGNIDNKVRYANSFLSDYHFVATPKSKERLEKCGIPANTIFNTGCPSLDYIPEVAIHPQKFNSLGGIGLETEALFKNKYIVVLQHSETTSSFSPRTQIRITIDAIEKLKYPTLWIWPNSDQGGDELIREITQAREFGKLKFVHFERSIEPKLFLSILRSAECIVGNSSVAIRECSLIGLPAVNIGGRQHNRERGVNVIDTEFDLEAVYNATIKQIKHGAYAPSNIYGDGKSGERIASLIKDLLD